MSQFTLTLQEIESVEGHDNLLKWFKAYNLRDYLTPEEIAVIRSRDTWSEDKLAEHILKTYYLREIGLETVGLFKMKLEDKLQDIMEEKAPLIYSASLKIDPINEFEINEVGRTSGTSTKEAEGNNLTINSVTPQGEIDKDEILKGSYASSTQANEYEDKAEVGENTDSTRKSTGHNQSQARLIREYRSTIVTINKDITRDLAELFIGIYG